MYPKIRVFFVLNRCVCFIFIRVLSSWSKADSVSLSSSWCSSCCGLQVGDESLIGLVLVQFLYTEVIYFNKIRLLSSSGPNITFVQYRRYLRLSTVP